MMSEGSMSAVFRYKKLDTNPPIGSLWGHHNGNVYRVLMITNSSVEDYSPDGRYPMMVVYQNQENGTVWSRRCDDWNRSMTRIQTMAGN